MKKKLWAGLASGLLLLGLAGVSAATTLTFDNPNALGVNLGGNMTWNGTGGGHLYMEMWDTTDYIITLSANTTVNDFQMNYQPWQGYGSNPVNNSGWLVDIKALDAGNQVLWAQQVDLAATAWDWNNWTTVSVNTANVAVLAFGPTGGAGGEPHGYWPSIDNLRIDEDTHATPEPATMLLLGSGLAGLLGARRKKKA